MLMSLALLLVIVRRYRLLSIARAVSAECDGRAEAFSRSPIPCAGARRIDPAHRPTFGLGEQRLQPPGDLGLRRHADDAIDFPSVPEQEERRDALKAEARRRRGTFVHVELDHAE